MTDGLICAFTYYGQAIAKGRPRATVIGGHARMYTPERTTAFEGKVRAIACVEMAKAGLAATPEACRVEMAFERCPPKSWSKKKTLEMRGLPITGRPDVDNQAKAILDALNGVVFEDDGQVSDLFVSRRWGETDSVRVAVSLASGDGLLTEAA